MIYIKNLFSFVVVVVVVALGFLLFPAVQAQAGFAECFVDIVKEATPSDGTDFDFTCTGGEGGNCDGAPIFTLKDGESRDNIGIGAFSTVTVAEENVPDGWGLDDINCVVTDGPDLILFDFNVVENGVVITCESPGDNPSATCTFKNIKQCNITIEKRTAQGNDTPFDFTAPGSSDPNFTLQNDEDVELFIDIGENVDVTELVPDGWILEVIDCSAPDGVVITEIPDGRNFACSSPDGNADCVFINTPIRPIPTLSEWALLAMAGVLGIIGLLAIRRRKVTA